MFKAQALSGQAIEVLGQLFVKGPTWDGNISSKSGRDELIEIGLAFRDSGWSSLTAEGIRIAVYWDRSQLHRRHDQSWIEKLRHS